MTDKNLDWKADETLPTGKGATKQRFAACQSASNFDPLSACNIDPTFGELFRQPGLELWSVAQQRKGRLAGRRFKPCS